MTRINYTSTGTSKTEEHKDAEFSADDPMELIKIEKSLRKELNELKQAFDFANFAIVSFDVEGNIVTFNKTFRELFKVSDFVSAEDISPKFLQCWLRENTKNAEESLKIGYQTLKKFKEPIVNIFELNDGRFIRGTSRAVICDGLVTTIVWSLVDITELKTNERVARHHANHDSLTNLPNRYRLFEKLESDIEAAKVNGDVLALLFMDIDYFKEINDTFGHHIGDQFLVEVANRISSSLRLHDTLARIGGDEFVVILNKTSSREMIQSIAERIKQTFESPFIINNNRIKSSISIGIAIYPQDSVSSRALMKQADAAMYKVKHSGRNSYCFFDTIEQ